VELAWPGRVDAQVEVRRAVRRGGDVPAAAVVGGGAGGAGVGVEDLMSGRRGLVGVHVDGRACDRGLERQGQVVINERLGIDGVP
jgi:hypothetical protein